MARKIKTGVFGGNRGHSMISALLRNPDAELVAVCDKYVPLLDSVKAEADRLGVKVELFDNFDDFKKLHPALANLKPEEMIKNGLSAPLHEGALRYYKEKGWVN